MKSDWRRPRAWPMVAALAMTWTLAAGPGLCGSAPEPLQNRSQDQPAPAVPGAGDGQADAPANVTVTGSGGNQDATVVVTPPVVGIGGVVIPEGGATAPDGRAAPATPGAVQDGRGTTLVPGGLKDGQAIPAVPGDLKDGRTTPLVPGTLKDGQVVPDAAKGATPPAGKAKETPANVTATGKGGDQNTKVLVTPQGTVPVAPLVPGKGAPATSVPTAPVTVGPDAKVVDAAGRPVAMPPGQEVTLPQGGKVIDASGNVVAVPPGGRVIVPARAMTPGDFLPKSNDKPEAGKKPGQEPKKTEPAKSQGKPQAKAPPGKADRAKAEKPPDKQAPPVQAAAAKPGDRIKIPEDACRKHTLDFLAGCWRGRITLQDRTGVTMRLCFNEAGVGKRIDLYSRNGKKCTGATHASWGGEGLSFSFNKIYCTDGKVGTDVPIVCKGCGDNTRCIGTEYNGSRTIGKTDFEIVRE